MKESFNGQTPFETSAQHFPLLDDEAMKEINKIPKQERREATQRARERVFALRKRLVDFELKTLNKLDELGVESCFPDVISEIKESVYEFMEKENLPNSLRAEIYSIFERWKHRYEMIATVLNVFDSSKKIFVAAFGHEPRGPVEVLASPASLTFLCSDPDDYTMIANGTFRERRAPTNEEKNWADKTAGIRIGFCLIPGLTYAVTAARSRVQFHKFNKFVNENGRYVSEPIKSASGIYKISTNPIRSEKSNWEIRGAQIITHEIQHAIHALSKKTKFASGEITGSTVVERASSLMYILQEERHIAEYRLKDEILAYLKEGYWKKDIVRILSEKESEGGLYDYESELRESIEEEMKDLSVQERKRVLDFCFSKVFDQSYYGLLERALSAFEEAEKRLGMNREQLIIFFEHEDLANWDRVVRRYAKVTDNTKIQNKETEEERFDEFDLPNLPLRESHHRMPRKKKY